MKSTPPLNNSNAGDAARESEVARLRKISRGSIFLRSSGVIVLLLVGASWGFGGFNAGDSFTPRRLENLSRFLREIVPYPVGAPGALPGAAGDWAADLLVRRGWEASKKTLALSAAAAVLAGALGLLLALPAARNVASPDSFSVPGGRPRVALRYGWKAVAGIARLALMFFRAVPEYIWAYLFLAMLGRQAWPAVLALALHNAGILGRLGAEVVENVEPSAPRALRTLGATRAQVAAIGVLPLVLPRFLLYFFYRWETCVRESTVLGLLGFTSLGYWIADARARDRYDEMVFYILLGAALVLIGDVVSAVTRAFVRRAS